MPNWLTNPLVPNSAIKPAQDALDTPTLRRSPLEAALRGFGSGALEELRGFSSPLSLAGLAAPAAGSLVRGGLGAMRAARGGQQALGALQKAAQRAGSLLDDMARETAELPFGPRLGVLDDVVRGGPADIPNNPVAQSLEVARQRALADFVKGRR